MSKSQQFSDFEKLIIAARKYSPEDLQIWLDRFINFVKTETDLELEEVKDERNLYGRFVKHSPIKIKTGKILYQNNSFYPHNLWHLIHECGHLASIPKEFRKIFKPNLEPNRNYSYYGEEFALGVLNYYWSDEQLAHYWGNFVAKKLEIPTNIFGLCLTEQIDQNGWEGHLRTIPFYAAKKTGFATKFGELLKFNA